MVNESVHGWAHTVSFADISVSLITHQISSEVTTDECQPAELLQLLSRSVLLLVDALYRCKGLYNLSFTPICPSLYLYSIPLFLKSFFFFLVPSPKIEIPLFLSWKVLPSGSTLILHSFKAAHVSYYNASAIHFRPHLSKPYINQPLACLPSIGCKSPFIVAIDVI